MPFNPNNKLGKRIMSIIQGYNHEKYWHRREVVVDSAKGNILIKLWYLLYIKRVDARLHCSLGTNVNIGNNYATPPNFPHGPSGIIIAPDVTCGSFCRIYQQVTITGGGVKIGNNCLIGAGAKILHGVTIGDNVKIGANCVVSQDVPSNSIAVMPRDIIFERKDKTTENVSEEQ